MHLQVHTSYLLLQRVPSKKGLARFARNHIEIIAQRFIAAYATNFIRARFLTIFGRLLIFDTRGHCAPRSVALSAGRMHVVLQNRRPFVGGGVSGMVVIAILLLVAGDSRTDQSGKC